MIKEVSDDDDFFAIGGDSLAAAHLSHSLGINMRLMYEFPSPSKLFNHLLEKKELPREGSRNSVSQKSDLEKENPNDTDLIGGDIPVGLGVVSNSSPLGTRCEENIPPKRLKVDSDKYVFRSKKDQNPWNLLSAQIQYSFSRCNKVSYVNACNSEDAAQGNWSVEFPRDRMVSMQKLWNVSMDSCVDASPLVVFKHSKIYLFIGSHSHKFLCIDAKRISIHPFFLLSHLIPEAGAAVCATKFGLHTSSMIDTLDDL
ncbi:PREDICTED: putative acyl-activating enzyme 19 [Tarenaya hassleriana]|uniref:putative acyl-activating enzyme 19 n=1 Tax=Tarenaya hassleriana TaxID=28532 RepID=UPI00053C545F|nr:PREDICTED: putative acyl-activating enzyme 19 [Tarenaya hassleriana]XP_010534183.1 PREDICTED: putative acyl-activating enzyme 19 [Tarenaya hassleriana]